MKETMRNKLVDAIFEFAGDEFTDMDSAQQIAGESEEKLVDRILDILEWYKNAYNEAI